MWTPPIQTDVPPISRLDRKTKEKVNLIKFKYNQRFAGNFGLFWQQREAEWYLKKSKQLFTIWHLKSRTSLCRITNTCSRFWNETLTVDIINMISLTHHRLQCETWRHNETDLKNNNKRDEKTKKVMVTPPTTQTHYSCDVKQSVSEASPLQASLEGSSLWFLWEAAKAEKVRTWRMRL